MPQVVLSLKTIAILLLLLLILLHIALYYSTGFNLIKSLIETLIWIFNQIKGGVFS